MLMILLWFDTARPAAHAPFDKTVSRTWVQNPPDGGFPVRATQGHRKTARPVMAVPASDRAFPLIPQANEKAPSDRSEGAGRDPG